LTLKNPGAKFRDTSQIRSNNDAIVDAIENTLSRDGTGPNHMESVLDMNSNRIINLAAPQSDNDAVRRVDVDSGIGADIQVVAGIATEVQTVAEDSADIQVVAGISGDVTTVASVATEVAALGPISADITTVAGVASSVPAVAAIDTDVTTVAGIASDVTTVAGSDADITAVAADLAGADTIGDAAALVNAGSPGLVVVRGAGDVVVRSFLGDANNGLTVANGNGVDGNPAYTLAQSIRPEDAPTFGGLTFGGKSRDPIPGAALSYLDDNGRLIKYLDRDGRERFGAGVRFIEQTENLRDPNEFVFSIVTEDSRLLLGFDDEGNATIPGFAGGGGGGGSYTPPSGFSTSYLVGNIRTYDDVIVATRHDGAFSYDVRRNGTSEPAVIQHYEPMLAFMVYGQSNAGFSGDDGGAQVVDKLFPTTCFSFGARMDASPPTEVNPTTLNSLRVLADIPSRINQLPATVGAFALEAFTRSQNGEATPGVFTWTAFEGGEPITSFERDTVNWDNLIAGASRMKTVAALYGRAVGCPALMFVQGEGGPQEGYQALLEALADDLCPELENVMDLDAEPKLLIVQTATTDTQSTQRQARLNQVAAARANSRILMAGTMYPFPLVDTIHPTIEGRLMQSEMMAEAYRRVWREGTFTPLWPVSAVRDGAQVDIVFAVPGNGLVLDDDWVLAVTNYGFAFVDSTSSATITGVAILNATTVRITLSNTPTGTDQRITYAAPIDTAENGWSSGRGQLYSPSSTPSFYASLGFDVPSHVRHYAVSFEQEITT
jgi:hypothetical protein